MSRQAQNTGAPSRRDQHEEKTLSVASLRQIDEICQEYERACRTVDISHQLANAPADVQVHLLRELLRLDLEYGVGGAAAEEQYLRRFPQHRQLVGQVFEEFRRRDPLLEDTASFPAEHGQSLASPAKQNGLQAAEESTLAGDAYQPGDRPPSAAAVNSPPAKPQTFGEYELLEVLGRGGMGIVYKARQRSPSRVVALKMILTGRLAHADELRRFHLDAETAARLNHPHIVEIFEVGQHNGQHYFTMSWIDGPTLAEKLTAGPLSPREAARLMLALARAVAYAHGQGVIHRDLKPGNVLLTTSGRPIVTDFGLAKVIGQDDPLTTPGQVLGTAAFMSPEQAGGQAYEAGPACDIYSLGAMLYQLLTHRPPFMAKSLPELLLHVQRREPLAPRKLRPDIPRELEWICLKCLEKTPSHRYEATALGDDLERFLQGEAIDRPGFGSQLRRAGRRAPALVYHEAAILLLAVVLHVNWLLFGAEEARHWPQVAVLAVWGVLCFAFQTGLEHRQWRRIALYAWSVADALLLTMLLALARPPIGILLVGYPLLIAGSGLFGRRRLSVVMTIACVVCFLLLWMMRPNEFPEASSGVIFAMVLCVHGAVVARQVRRFQALSDYYQQWAA